LVPLYAKGAGSELFADLVDGNDPKMPAIYGLTGAGFDGSYIDNTDVFTVMNLAAAPVPLPAGIWLFGSGFLGLILWVKGLQRRNRVLNTIQGFRINRRF
jgi:alkaline phosphatase